MVMASESENVFFLIGHTVDETVLGLVKLKRS